jgi:hypothetical protein
MITFENGTLIVDRSQAGEDVHPLLAPGKTERWYLELRITDKAALDYLIDAEIVGDDIPVRYVAQNGESFSGTAQVEESLSDGEQDLFLLRGKGKPPALFVADGPDRMA